MRFAILTISDRSARGERADLSGKALADLVAGQGWEIAQMGIVPDEASQIQQQLTQWADSHIADVILTTGGTGFSPRDVTPEATSAVLDRPTPGLAEAMRAASIAKTPHAMLSRAVAGIRGTTLIVNLPGSPTGAVENLQVILSVLPHAVELLSSSPHAEQGHKLAG
jgi:molybdenum cofactor synthesis domain-containing protein